MAPIQPSFVLQSRSDHPASLFRLMAAGAVGPGAMAAGATSHGGGVSPFWGSRLAVSGTGGMNVSVGTGLVYMPGAQAWQGLYVGYNTAAYTVSVPAASATQWRSDYIIARQHDTTYGDGDSNWDIVDVAGAFSSSQPGSLPSLAGLNSVILAIIRVVPNMTNTNGVGTVVDSRVYSNLPGPIYTSSGNKPPLTMPEGTMWWETDTDSMGLIVGGAYQYFLTTVSVQDTWHSLSPRVQSPSTLQADLPTSGYRHSPYDPNIMEIMGSLDVHTTDMSNGSIILNMPAGYRPAANYQRIPMMFDGAAPFTGAPYLRFETSGNVTSQGVGLATPSSMYFNGQIRTS